MQNTHDVEDDDWTVVTRGPKQRTESNADSGQRTRIQYEKTEPAKGKKRKKKRAKRRTYMTAEDIEELKNRLGETEWWAKTHDLLIEALDGHTCTSMQCLGVGQIAERTMASHQFACALLVREVVGHASTSIADPVMTERDKALARAFGVDVVDAVDTKQIRIPDACTIFFMPHCTRDVNGAVFREWERKRWQTHYVFFGNNIATYEFRREHLEGRPPVFLSGENIALVRFSVEGLLEERPCPNPNLSTSEYAFNDLCVTTLKKEASVVLPQAQIASDNSETD